METHHPMPFHPLDIKRKSRYVSSKVTLPYTRRLMSDKRSFQTLNKRTAAGQLLSNERKSTLRIQGINLDTRWSFNRIIKCQVTQPVAIRITSRNIETIIHTSPKRMSKKSSNLSTFKITIITIKRVNNSLVKSISHQSLPNRKVILTSQSAIKRRNRFGNAWMRTMIQTRIQTITVKDAETSTFDCMTYLHDASTK